MNDRAVPFISLDDVSVRLYDGRAFNHANWEILSDQNWAVVGPNGSGKSTLMKALCSQVPVVDGKITYHFSSNGTPPHDRIAYVAFDSQTRVAGCEGLYHQARWNSGVGHGALSVSDYLSERRVRGFNSYQVVDEQPDPLVFLAHRERIVKLLGLEALLDRSLWQVSNGERRKVMLAQALLKSPRLLILDNPFTGLDVGFRARLAELIGGLAQEGMRLIVVMHGTQEIPPGITHVLVVENSEIVAQGPKKMILDGVPHALCAFAEPQSDGKAWTVVHAEHQDAKEGQHDAGAWTAVHPERQGDTGNGAGGRVLVQMAGVSVAYGGVQILKGIDWTVRQGEHWALVGPNGAGKTTLLSLIMADNPQAYANCITLFGQRRGSGESIWEIKRRIGWVAPELHLYYPRRVSCFDVVCSGFFASVGRHHHCSPQQREKALAWMERLDVSQHIDLAFGEISEGEQRLVLIARALVMDPELLVLDEPCQGLDTHYRDRVLQTVDAIGQRGDSGVIYVTHDPHALPTIVSHVLRLDKGRIVARCRLGEPDDHGN
jgi:molybdate transport system ATP-binding protein